MNFLIVLIVCLAAVFGHPLGEPRNSFAHITEANQDLDVFEGDLRITIDQYNEVYGKDNSSTNPDVQSAVQKDDQYKWPNDVVPYLISSQFSVKHRNLIKESIRDIENAVPCVRYEEVFAPTTDRTYLHIKSDGGCWSYVGMVFRNENKEQPLSIEIDYCTYKDIIIHELVHALGVWHEQSRPDRDNYITIHPENMWAGTEGNFEKRENTWDRGSPYDPESIMHYENYAFTHNEQMTITWNADPTKKLGGDKLSPSDIYQLNSYYKCSPTTDPTTTTTTTIRTTKPTTTKTTTTKSTTMKPTTTKPTTTKTTTTKTTTTMKTTTPKTTKSTTTTEMPPTGDCGDKKFLKCVRAYWNPDYWCSDKRKYDYKTMCPQSCKMCDAGSDEIQCMNFRDDDGEDCEMRELMGDCTIGTYSIRKDMKMKCSKTCCEAGKLNEVMKKNVPSFSGRSAADSKDGVLDPSNSIE